MIAILTDPGIGGTFVTWTAYYLSGKTEYFSAKHQAVMSLVDDPLTDINAHNFRPNQLVTSHDVDTLLPLLANTDEYVYMHQFRTGTHEAVQELCEKSSKIITLSVDFKQVLYQCSYTTRAGFAPAWESQKMLVTADDIYEDFTNHFFKESKQNWAKENLNDIWDKREFIALNFSPFNHDSILNYVNDKTQCYNIDAVDVWTRFDQCIPELFKYLGVPVDQSRYQSWPTVYNKWKNTHTQRLVFAQNFKLIIDNILLGIDLDLVSFELDIMQEAAIQHYLIYKHNLNFKTWQLVKFTNTKQLHTLLEPNIHDLGNSVNTRLAQQVY